MTLIPVSSSNSGTSSLMASASCVVIMSTLIVEPVACCQSMLASPHTPAALVSSSCATVAAVPAPPSAAPRATTRAALRTIRHELLSAMSSSIPLACLGDGALSLRSLKRIPGTTTPQPQPSSLCAPVGRVRTRGDEPLIALSLTPSARTSSKSRDVSPISAVMARMASSPSWRATASSYLPMVGHCSSRAICYANGDATNCNQGRLDRPGQLRE